MLIISNLISVIVPIYNGEKYISRCINSILCQTHKNIQLILVNDGSKDKTIEICNYYKSIDDRILVINKINEGVSKARNAGLGMAKGDYIGFVDSDDYIDENMYEILINRIISDQSDLCTMILNTINIFNNKEKKSIKKISNLDAIEKMFLLKFPTSLWAYLYKKSAIEGLFLNEDIHFFEDFEYNNRILLNCNTVSLCYKDLYHYEINENSVNKQNINDKKITCLMIYDIVINQIKYYPAHFLSYTQYFRAHFLISIIINVTKSDKVEEKYFNLLKKKSRLMLSDIIKSKYVPLKYKLTIFVCSINPIFFYKIMSYKRR